MFLVAFGEPAAAWRYAPVVFAVAVVIVVLVVRGAIGWGTGR